ncbi:MAG: hypothetical protein M3Z66_18410 [Chloroflexota bacterium]|nr:hypothetical protein [Chloroflexota bacterium]
MPTPTRTWIRKRLPRRALIMLSLAGALLLLFAGGIAFTQQSARSGPTWRLVGLPGLLVHSIAAGPGAGSGLDLIAGAHDGVYRRGRNRAWTKVLAANDVWDVALLPDGRTILGADNDGYVDVSRDAGQSWHRVLINPGGCYAVSAQPHHPQHLLAGASGGIYLSLDGGRHWKRRLPLHDSAGAAFIWQPGSDRTVFGGAVAGGPGGSGFVYVSRDGGQTWHVFGRHLESTGGIMSLAITGSTQVYAGTMGNAVWKESAAGAFWRKRADGMPQTGDHVAGMTALPGQPSVLFAGTLGHGVFRTTDGGTHWSDISGNLLSSPNTSTVLSVVYSPLDRALFAGTTAGIYQLPIKQALK